MADIDIIALRDRLDTILEQYLTLLDVYTKTQQEIQTHLSSGFFCLAQANARAPLGRRYGKDWYDDRTKATTRCVVGLQENEEIRVKVVEAIPQPAEQLDIQEKSSDTDFPTPPPTPEIKTQPATTVQDSATTKTKRQQDPLFWFGMLPSPSIRAAKTAFKAAFVRPEEDDNLITKANNAARDMRMLEMSIRKLRKAIRQQERHGRYLKNDEPMP